MTMSERLAVMRHGRIEQIGAPQDVYESPATEFVAGFLGASNLLSGEVKERDAAFATVLVSGGSLVAVPAERLNGTASSVRVGVRPEKIRLERDAGEAHANGEARGNWNSISGTLKAATYMGVSYQYTVEGPDERTLTVYTQNLEAGPAPVPGERVRLSWLPEHTFVVQASEGGGSE